MNAKRTLRWVWSGVVALALVAVILMVAGLWFAHLADTRHDFSEIVAKLESGEVELGTDVVDVLGYGKPVAEDVEGEFYSATYSYKGEILVLYAKSHEIPNRRDLATPLFAAQHIQGGQRPGMTWYFCDTDLLAEYVQATTRVTGAPQGPPVRAD